jgi:hypothetical protein
MITERPKESAPPLSAPSPRPLVLEKCRDCGEWLVEGECEGCASARNADQD